MDRDRMGGSVALGALLATGVVLLAVAAFAVLSGGFGATSGGADRVLLVFECPDAQGVRVAWVALELDLVSGAIRGVETSVPATLGGAGSLLARDAHPFGGPGAVAEALAGAGEVRPMPAIGLSQDDWRELLGRGGGAGVDLPGQVNVFDGDRLVLLEAGWTPIDEDSVSPLLSATAYLEPAVATGVRRAVTSATAQALIAQPDYLAAARAERRIASSVSPGATRRLAQRASAALARASFRPD